jgi:hypothetical protein
MAETIYALPIARDKAQAVRDFVIELLGPRREAFEESWRSKGITREVACLQEMPEGSIVLVYLEADDLEHAFRELAVSDGPFDSWYRDQVLDIYGVDLTAPSGPASEHIASWTAL